MQAGATARAGLRLAAALLSLLVLASTAAWLAHDRRQTLASAAALNGHRAAALADQVDGALAVARAALARIESSLGQLPPGAPVAAALAAVAAEQRPLLAALALPMQVRAIGADGRPLLEDAAAPGAPGALPTAGVWQVGLAQGPAGSRSVPLLRRAAPNRHGVAAFVVELDPAALLGRLHAARLSDGSSAALLRIDADGSAALLAQAPSDEADPGPRTRGALAAALARSPQGAFDAQPQPDQPQRVVAYQRLDGDAAALVVTSGLATDALLAGWRARLPWAVGVALLLLGAIVAGVRRLERVLQVRSQAARQPEPLPPGGEPAVPASGRDDTDARRVDDALRASEASHRAMFEANPHPMWVYDRATLAFLAVNDAAVRRYGFTREEFLRLSIADIRPPEDVPRLLDNVAAVRNGIDLAGSWRHCTKDGRLIEVEITSHALRFAGRDAELVLAHDVTRRNEAERMLRDREQRLRLALQAANQGLYDLDLRTGVALVSPEYARMLGWEPEGFTVTTAAWREWLHPDDRDAVYRRFEDYVAGRRDDYRVEFRQQMRDGGWKWILSVGRIVERDADGRPLRMLGTHTDLDAIKAAQAAQLAATQRFETLFRAAPDAIAVSDRADGRLLQVNDAFCRWFGHAREQVLGQDALELGLWTDPRTWLDAVERVRAGETVQGLQGVARRRGGECFDVLVSAEAIDFDGRAALLVMLHDISGRRQLEDALRTSQARLTHLLARAPTVVYTARADGDYAATYYSPNLPQLLGWQPQDFLADSAFWIEHLHPDDRDAVLRDLAALATRDELALEYRFRHADGRWRWMRDQVSVQRDARGTAVELVGAWIDITERREAEDQVRRLAAELDQRVQERTAQLAQSEARYRAIFETVPISIGEEDWSAVQRLLRELRSRGVSDAAGYFAARPDFVHDCLRAVTVRRLNRKALALHDARDQHADLPDLQAVYPRPDDLHQFVGELEAMWAGQRLLTAKRSLPSVTGRPLSLMMTMSLPALDDDDGTALVCLVDITEIDRLNAELDLSVERLRKANRELETFTYSVSHDLKAPLRGIDGYSRLLLSDHFDRLDDEGRQFLQHIRQATQHMGALIDDLLTYSRLERRDLAIVPLPLADAVRTALAGLRQDLDAAGVQLEVRVDPGLRARADAQGLTMALRNLVDNAVKFSRTRATPRVTIEATRSEGGVRLAVHDNGVGFDMKFHDRIFSIFQRLHRAEDYPGTGVGLAIVRKAMERMGGRVWAHSQPGEGATFTLELPEADPS
ncbi:MAG: PAS domain S-box protein [Rubrivivax sp.]|nr:PAS domain S-box protein [Rubrivivax sp.]